MSVPPEGGHHGTESNPIPQGYHTVTPSLVVQEAARALEFYQKAFGAEETLRMPGPGGSIMQAEFRIGDWVIRLRRRSSGQKEFLSKFQPAS